MVERLKEAIEKARREREKVLDGREPAGTADAPASMPVPRSGGTVAGAWEALRTFEPDPAHLEAGRVVSFARADPVHVTFDLLRTRLVKACRDNGWRRIVVTSPTKNCGKSTVCANLAGSLSHQKNLRTVLIDLDLRSSKLQRLFGLPDAPAMDAVLAGRVSLAEAMVRIGDSLAVLANAQTVPGSGELLQGEAMGALLDGLDAEYAPDIVLIDTPPVLIADDVVGLTNRIDAILLVVAAGDTSPANITAVDQLLADDVPQVGIVLNRVNDEDIETYQESYT